MAHSSTQADQRLPDPRRSLALLDSEQRQLCERLAALTPTELELPSNLPGWRILDLGAHVTRVCDSMILAAQRATVGDQAPAFGAAAKPRDDAIRAMTPADWVALQRDAYQRLTHQVAALTDEQLERFTFPHPQGQRSIRWACTQLLAEVAFHRWDLAWSLGERAPLDDGLAAYLLRFLLDPNELIFRSKKAAAETAEQFSLVTDDGLSWVLTSTAGGTSAESRADGPPPRIRATPGWLALAVYGRVRLDVPAFDLTGPPTTADRFAAIFGPSA